MAKDGRGRPTLMATVPAEKRLKKLKAVCWAARKNCPPGNPKQERLWKCLDKITTLPQTPTGPIAVDVRFCSQREIKWLFARVRSCGYHPTW